MSGAVFIVVAVLGFGNPAVRFQKIELPQPLTEAACFLQPAVQAIAEDAGVQRAEHDGWRVIYWDCVKGQPL